MLKQHCSERQYTPYLVLKYIIWTLGYKSTKTLFFLFLSFSFFVFLGLLNGRGGVCQLEFNLGIMSLTITNHSTYVWSLQSTPFCVGTLVYRNVVFTFHWCFFLYSNSSCFTTDHGELDFKLNRKKLMIKQLDFKSTYWYLIPSWCGGQLAALSPLR